MSVTWVGNKKAVVVLFEGVHQMASEYGREYEDKTFRSSVLTIFNSLR